MNFKHACFISYRNGDRKDKDMDPRRQDIRDTINAFAQDLRDELKRELLTYMSHREALVFLDQDKDCLKEGDPLMPTISKAVCKSVCMIVIFTRHYLDEEFLTCAAELEGMLRRLEHRCQKIGVSPEISTDWIATAIFREPDRVPAILKKNLYYDFTGYENSSTPLRDNPNYCNHIKTLAKEVADFWEKMAAHDPPINFCDDCDTFALLDPSENEDELRDFVKKHRIQASPKFSRS